MTAPISAAASAYAAAARLAATAAPATIPGGVATPTSFTDLLKEAIGSVDALGHKSDAETRAMVNGKANMVDVVTAVSETEVAIDAVVAVRDKVIQAYQNIMQMPI
jgi:flagellar hook-basal body complex protein FliE